MTERVNGSARRVLLPRAALFLLGGRGTEAGGTSGVRGLVICTPRLYSGCYLPRFAYSSAAMGPHSSLFATSADSPTVFDTPGSDEKLSRTGTRISWELVLVQVRFRVSNEVCETKRRGIVSDTGPSRQSSRPESWKMAGEYVSRESFGERLLQKPLWLHPPPPTSFLFRFLGRSLLFLSYSSAARFRRSPRFRRTARASHVPRATLMYCSTPALIDVTALLAAGWAGWLACSSSSQLCRVAPGKTTKLPAVSYDDIRRVPLTPSLPCRGRTD